MSKEVDMGIREIAIRNNGTTSTQRFTGTQPAKTNAASAKFIMQPMIKLANNGGTPRVVIARKLNSTPPLPPWPQKVKNHFKQRNVSELIKIATNHPFSSTEDDRIAAAAAENALAKLGHPKTVASLVKFIKSAGFSLMSSGCIYHGYWDDGIGNALHALLNLGEANLTDLVKAAPTIRAILKKKAADAKEDAIKAKLIDFRRYFDKGMAHISRLVPVVQALKTNTLTLKMLKKLTDNLKMPKLHGQENKDIPINLLVATAEKLLKTNNSNFITEAFKVLKILSWYPAYGMEQIAPALHKLIAKTSNTKLLLQVAHFIGYHIQKRTYQHNHFFRTQSGDRTQLFGLLKKMLQHTDSAVRIAAEDAFFVLLTRGYAWLEKGVPAELNKIIARTKDTKRLLRIVKQHLPRYYGVYYKGYPELVNNDGLITLIQHPNRNIRAATEKILLRIIYSLPSVFPSKAKELLKQLTAAAKSKGSPARPHVANIIYTHSVYERLRSAKTWRSIKERRAVPALVFALRDTDKSQSGRAAYLLGRIGDRSAVPALLKKYGESGEYVRKVIVGAFTKFKDPRITAHFKTYLKHGDFAVRLHGVKVLCAIGNPLPVLIQALGDDDRHVRAYAAKRLGKIGSAAASPAVYTALGKLLKDPDEEVRDAAIWALNRI